MSDTYDFQNLSFDDFERLSRDLLQEALEVSLEAFKVGRDRGIDLRFAPADGDTLIVQCKRYAPNGFSRLFRDLKSEELPKVRKLAPKRYVLATSCALSPDNKEKLLELLTPYCQSTGDIFGASELNALITKHPSIERAHFKLWLGTTTMLQRVVHAGIFNLSQHEVDRLRTEISRYVVHGGFHRALEVLDSEHHCVLVGIPGIGKTTAARLLLAHYLRADFRVVTVSKDIAEAWDVLDHAQSDERIIVYYDDFLGQMTFQQKLAKNEDKRLLDLMDHCKLAKNKRFILTTRDYIFDQALAAYEPLGHAANRLQRSKVLLDDYNAVVRARLLANHLQFSDLPYSLIRGIVANRGYLTIIQHRNFLPRVVENICKAANGNITDANAFITNAIALLDDHAAVWRAPFRQVSSDARLLLHLLASMKGEGEIGRLEEAWRTTKPHISGLSHDRLFTDVLREIEGSFTSTQQLLSLASKEIRRTGYLVRFINPSAREYVTADLLSKPESLSAVLNAAIAFKQLFFWQEARVTLTEESPLSAVTSYQHLIATRAMQLLSAVEPEATSWGGEVRLRWRSNDQFQRLFDLFNALEKFGDSRLAADTACELLALTPKSPLESLRGKTLRWFPYIVKALIRALIQHYPPGSEIFAKLAIWVKTWPDEIDRLEDFGPVWEAAATAMVSKEADIHFQQSLKWDFVDRFQVLVEELPDDLTADELLDMASTVEGLADQLGYEFKREYEKLEKRAKRARENENESDDEEIRLAPIYGKRQSQHGREFDVDGLFDELRRQLPEDSALSN